MPEEPYKGCLGLQAEDFAVMTISVASVDV